MDVILLHYAAPPVVGGVESVIGHHARLMAQDGHRVKIAAGRGEAIIPGVEFVHEPRFDSRHPKVLALKGALDAGRLPEEFETFTRGLTASLEKIAGAVGVLIAHNVCSLHKNLPLTAAIRRFYRHPGAPRLVIWNHDLAWTSARYRDELYPGYPWDLLRSDWPGATQVVVSKLRQDELAGLLGIPPERIHVIPNGLDAGQFLKLEPETTDLVEGMNLLDACPLLLLPVRITLRKNIELALRTVAALRERYPRAVLVVTGPMGPHNPANRVYFQRLLDLRHELGLDEGRLKGAYFLAQEREGFLPDEIVADFYSLADALLLPSREEGFGIPVLEAGLKGLPVFCSDIPPLRELGGEQAVYFSPNAGPDQLAGLIAGSLQSNPSFHLKVKTRSRYTWKKIYQRRIAPLLRPSALLDSLPTAAPGGLE
jgi:glycosyltransferase involved in cell wall biosynthesis